MSLQTQTTQTKPKMLTYQHYGEKEEDMSRTEVIKGNVCVGFFGDDAKEIQMLGEFMIGKKIIERTVKYENECRYITVMVE